jgi:diadenosine tetraphosphatase ApaH/serine/threonine PP2A family protein phosphatase
MWSDPSDVPGVHVSPRNVGVMFGPDVTAAFLAHNHLQVIIRSHECVPNGTQVRW